MSAATGGGMGIKKYRGLAACMYQFAGNHNAPERWMDVLSAAARGLKFTEDGLLPYTPDESTTDHANTCGCMLCRLQELQARNAELERIAASYRNCHVGHGSYCRVQEGGCDCRCATCRAYDEYREGK